MRIPLQAVILDYGNVLSRPQRRAEVEGMAEVLKAPVARFEELYWKYRQAFDEAALSPEAYWEGVARGLSRELPAAALERLTELDNISWADANPAMLAWARGLRGAGVRTAVLSNMPVTLRTYLSSQPWFPEFDFACYSCDVRSAKPAPEIFRHCLEGLRVAASEALFLDDREENIDGARKLGIHTIYFGSPAEAQGEIDRRYSLPVRLTV